jgi:hypothetical protein
MGRGATIEPQDGAYHMNLYRITLSRDGADLHGYAALGRTSQEAIERLMDRVAPWLADALSPDRTSVRVELVQNGVLPLE